MYSETSSSPALANHATHNSSKDIRRAKTEKYTEDTMFVAQWLKEKAKNLRGIGYLLKREVREDGRDYELRLGNFTRLAERLVKESSFTVTRDVMEAIERVITLRAECNDMHENDVIGTAERRQSHIYPLQVFRELAEILRPKLEIEPVSPSAEPDTTLLSLSAVARTRSAQEAIDAEWPELPGKR